jgi:quercetin dioxygenase-like cupin family protein
MKIFRAADLPFKPADPHSFTGAAKTKLLASDEDSVNVHVYHVQFSDGARTHWHTHSGPQWLLVTEGRIRVQCEGEPSEDVDTGGAVLIPPGQKHWHGAVPGHRGVHLAINVKVKTDWLDAVSDEDYRG